MLELNPALVLPSQRAALGLEPTPTTSFKPSASARRQSVSNNTKAAAAAAAGAGDPLVALSVRASHGGDEDRSHPLAPRHGGYVAFFMETGGQCTHLMLLLMGPDLSTGRGQHYMVDNAQSLLTSNIITNLI